MPERHRADVLVSCLHGRCDELIPALTEEINRRGLSEEVDVVEAGCRGLCAMGPVLLIEPGGLFYTGVQPGDVPELVEETLIKGRTVERLAYKEPATHQAVCRYEDIPFYRKWHLPPYTSNTSVAS